MPHGWEEYKTNTQMLLSQRLFCKPNSLYALPVQFVPKDFNAEGKPLFQMIIDYCAANMITFKDQFPLPYPEDLMAKLQGMKWFSKRDFFSRYHKHCNHPDSIQKTAFISPDALYQCLVMPCGFTNAHNEFMRLIIDLLRQHIDDNNCTMIIDDILINPKNDEAESHHVETVLDTISKVGFRLQETKCTFGKMKAPLLRFGINGENDSIRMTHQKVKAITD
jgi:hypothetical protein